MKRLTIAQIEKIGLKYRYFLIRDVNLDLTAVNSKIIAIAKKRANRDSNFITKYIAFIPCTLNTYISHKRKNNLITINEKTN